jgi:hypothetical protein
MGTASKFIAPIIKLWIPITSQSNGTSKIRNVKPYGAPRPQKVGLNMEQSLQRLRRETAL